MEGAFARLAANVGELVTVECGYDLGGLRCGVDLSGVTETDVRIETVVDARTLTLTAADIDTSKADDYFGNGHLQPFTGSNAGLDFRIKSYTKATRTVVLNTKAPLAFAVGDRVVVVPGCRHRYLEDCIPKWSNGPRFGGAEAMPGGDRSLEAPQ
jgi:uncharacterized phage protein (TIGR02218 family)